ncbi:hypothetical protein GCM10023231_02040 [Olivibacter ginsenosidimutans]|uniref:DUF4249 domain-containing protein n=1 Tax=Olivibacter ginsenosidimutans TaxID=1176537 RepID=A0ABP9AFD8_9SPHI
MKYYQQLSSINKKEMYIDYFSLFYKGWKNLFRLITVSICLFSLFACEKEIDLDLKGTEQKYVIEAVLTDQEGGCRVLISKTKDFKEDNSRIQVSDALVTINDDTQTYHLTETSTGVYELASLKGVTHKTYQLNVQIGDEIFTAHATMPARVNMDSLYIAEEFVYDKTYKLPTVDFIDPAQETNQYRFVIYVNNQKKKQLFPINDDLSDGRANSIRLYLHVGEDEDNPENKRIESGDLLKVEMLTIDLPVYKYFFSLQNSATGENQSATPANPVSNITGGALGYFSAHTLQSKEIRVP